MNRRGFIASTLAALSASLIPWRKVRAEEKGVEPMLAPGRGDSPHYVEEPCSIGGIDTQVRFNEGPCRGSRPWRCASNWLDPGTGHGYPCVCRS